MNRAARSAPLRLPVLTEVVDLPVPLPLIDDAEPEWARTARFAPAPPVDAPPVLVGSTPESKAAGPDEAQLSARILADLQRQVALMLEHRVREALAPTFAAFADALIAQTRGDLASALQDMVARAVAQEMARQRAR